jgi:CHASE2 domain-containing sensor protein
MKSRSNTARTGLRHRYEASLWILLAASLALLIHARGLNYLAEMTVFDWLTRSMPESSESDRIVIVGYDNSDLRRFKSTDVSDRLLARAIEAVAAQEPAVIGMNFLREAHLPPGRDELIQTIRTTSNLYGINNTTLSSSVLAGAIDSVRSDRTGSSASITDANGMVRVMQLGYLHTRTKDVHRSFSMRLAEAYTEAAGKPIALTRQGSLRTADGREYRANDAATGGYIDENPRNFAFLSAHPKNRDFPRVSFGQLLDGRFDPALLRGKIVIIGATADSIGTHLPNAWNDERQTWSDTLLRATETDRLLGVALDDRGMIQSPQGAWHYAWVALWAALCIAIQILGTSTSNRMVMYLLALLALSAMNIAGLRLDVWLPVSSPLIVIAAAAAYCMARFFADEHALRRGLALMHWLIDRLPDPVYVLDPQGNLRIVNEAFCKLAARPQSELINQKLEQILSMRDAGSAADDTIGLRAFVAQNAFGKRYKLLVDEHTAADEAIAGFRTGIVRVKEILDVPALLPREALGERFEHATGWASKHDTTLNLWLIRFREEHMTEPVRNCLIHRLAKGLPEALAFGEIDGRTVAVLTASDPTEARSRLTDLLAWPLDLDDSSNQQTPTLSLARWPIDGQTLVALVEGIEEHRP